MIHHAPVHTRGVFQPQEFPKIVDWVISKARALGAESLAACGHSGLIVAGGAAYVLGIPVIAVRKPGDPAHDSYRVNAMLPTADVRYVIVDDLVASGSTCRRILDGIAEMAAEDGGSAACCAVLLYHDKYNNPETVPQYLGEKFGGVPVYVRGYDA